MCSSKQLSVKRTKGGLRDVEHTWGMLVGYTYVDTVAVKLTVKLISFLFSGGSFFISLKNKKRGAENVERGT